MLKLEDITKSFGATQALKGVTLEVDSGTIQAIAGENGSGKSTLMKVLAGVHQPDSGRVILDGKQVELSSPIIANQHGIATVFQELSLFPHLSGYANIMIGREKTKGPFLDKTAIRRKSDSIMAQAGFPKLNLSLPIGSLPTASQQLIEILKCLAKDPQVMILDEPTAAIRQEEVSQLFEIMLNLKSKGITILFISHHLEEVFEVADQVAVLRDGEQVLSEKIKNLDEAKIVNAMLGRRLDQFYPKRKKTSGNQVLLELRSACTDELDGVDLKIYQGEILGVGGVVGSGQSSLAELIAGVLPLKSGQMFLHNNPVRFRHVQDAIAKGVVYIPEDRRLEGFLPNLSIKTNLSLPIIAKKDCPFLTKVVKFIKRNKEENYAQEIVKRLRIKTSTLKAPVASLSGGTQQKVVVGKWIQMAGICLVLNDPTKGIDVGSKADLFESINELADLGMSIVFVSSHNPELLGMCDRIVVLSRGKIVSELQGEQATEEAIISAMALK